MSDRAIDARPCIQYKDPMDCDKESCTGCPMFGSYKEYTEEEARPDQEPNEEEEMDTKTIEFEFPSKDEILEKANQAGAKMRQAVSQQSLSRGANKLGRGVNSATKTGFMIGAAFVRGLFGKE